MKRKHNLAKISGTEFYTDNDCTKKYIVELNVCNGEYYFQIYKAIASVKETFNSKEEALNEAENIINGILEKKKFLGEKLEICSL